MMEREIATFHNILQEILTRVNSSHTALEEKVTNLCIAQEKMTERLNQMDRRTKYLPCNSCPEEKLKCMYKENHRKKGRKRRRCYSDPSDCSRTSEKKLQRRSPLAPPKPQQEIFPQTPKEDGVFPETMTSSLLMLYQGSYDEETPLTGSHILKEAEKAVACRVLVFEDSAPVQDTTRCAPKMLIDAECVDRRHDTQTAKGSLKGAGVMDQDGKFKNSSLSTGYTSSGPGVDEDNRIALGPCSMDRSRTQDHRVTTERSHTAGARTGETAHVQDSEGVMVVPVPEVNEVSTISTLQSHLVNDQATIHSAVHKLLAELSSTGPLAIRVQCEVTSSLQSRMNLLMDRNSHISHSASDRATDKPHTSSQFPVSQIQGSVASSINPPIQNIYRSPSQKNLTDYDILSITKMLGDGWQSIGIQCLDFTMDELSRIDADNPKMEKKIFEMLSRWTKKNGRRGGTIQKLLDALDKSDDDVSYDVYKYLEDHLK